MIKNFNQKIEELFEQPLDQQRSQTIDELKKTFNLAEDNHQIENLSYIFSTAVGKNEVSFLFSQLSSFFELGFLFEKTRTKQYQAIQMFAYSMQIKNLDGLSLLRLPTPDLFKVLSTNTQTFLSKANLTNFGENQNLTSYLLRISEKLTFVLMLSLADPWAKNRIEALQKTLMKINFE